MSSVLFDKNTNKYIAESNKRFIINHQINYGVKQMAKRYIFETRASKNIASEAFANGSPVRVSVLSIDPVTHDAIVTRKKVFRSGETLTRVVQEFFGIIHAQRDRLIYEVGQG